MNTTTISMTHEVYPPNCNSRKDNSGIFLLCKKRTVRLGRFFKTAQTRLDRFHQTIRTETKRACRLCRHATLQFLLHRSSKRIPSNHRVHLLLGRPQQGFAFRQKIGSVTIQVNSRLYDVNNHRLIINAIGSPTKIGTTGKLDS